MIQRRQTLTLLLAGIWALLSFKIPYLHASTESFSPHCIYGIFGLKIVLALVALFSSIAIFRYKKLKCQKGICTVNIVLLLLLILSQLSLYFLHEIGCDSLYELCPFLSLLFTISSRNSIQKDQNLLKAADRLR